MTSTPPPRERMTWMDSLRGLAIGLVIFWHSAGILKLYDIAVPDPLVFVNEVLSPYRMPTLMFLSGMLLNASLRKPLPTYIAGKLRFVAYPLVLWTVLHFFLYQPDTSLLNLTFWTTSYLWFLAYILAYYLAAPFLRRVPTWLLVLSPLAVTFFVEDEGRRRFFFLAAFFFFGQLVTENRPMFDRVISSRWVWLAVPVALGFGLYSAAVMPLRYQGLLAVFSVFGIASGIRLVQWLNSFSWSEPIQFVGRHSLIYYVTHFPIIILVVLLLDKTLGLPTDIVILTGFVLAIALGTMCAWLSENTIARWAFIAPKRGDGERFDAYRSIRRDRRMQASVARK